MRPVTDDPTDDDLRRRCLAHDEEAWTLLVDRYAGYIYAIATRGFGLPPDQAEDVLQETALSLVQHLTDYRGSGPLRAWIGTVAANAARQFLRRRKPAEALPEGEAADAAQEQALTRAEEAFVVQAAVQRLPDECRTIIAQAFYDQRRYAEIAAALGIPEGTVASRLARCLARLRELLTPP